GPAQKKQIVIEFFDVACLKVERIVSNQDGGIRAAFDFDGTPNVLERSAAGAYVVVRFVGLKVLVLVIEHHATAGDSFVCLIIIFNVIGLEALVGVVDVHGAVGDGEIPLALLRASGGKLGDTALRGRFLKLMGCRRTRHKDSK